MRVLCFKTFSQSFYSQHLNNLITQLIYRIQKRKREENIPNQGFTPPPPAAPMVKADNFETKNIYFYQISNITFLLLPLVL
jgi:hypothetical protein